MSEITNAKPGTVARLMGVFSRSKKPNAAEARTVPAFVEEAIREKATSAERPMQVGAMYPGTQYSYGGGPYYSDGQKFPSGIILSGSSPIIDHNRTRSNAREAYHTSTAARAIVSRFVEAVVGDGVRVEPQPAAALLGLSQEEAEEWSRNVKERFGLWANSKYATLDETMTLYQLQRLIETQARRDGEYFVRFHYLKDADRPNPLALSSIEQSQIIGNPYTTTDYFPWRNDGVQRDSRGREIAFYVKVRDKDGSYVNRRIPASEAGRKMMVHGFIPEYAGQTRGYSPLHHALQEFSQMTNFTIAQIQKAILQSSVVMSKETDLGATPTGNPFSLDGAGAVLPAPTVAEVAPQVQTGTVPPYVPINVSLSPGGHGIFNNGPGERLVPFNHTAPSDSFAPFSEAFIAILSASCSIPYEIVLQRFGSNYSASRACMVMFYRYALVLRGEHKSDFLTAAYESWLSEEIAAGRISAKGWLDPVLRLAWLNAEWSGPLMPDIDPEASVNAAREAIEANLSNVALEAQRYNGSDAAMNRAINERILTGAEPVPWNKKEIRPERGTERGAEK
jgi:capsid protein